MPGSPALYIERGVLYVQMGRFNEADADFQKADSLEPAQNLGTVARGISLVQENELGRSHETVREGLKRALNDPVLNYLLADVLIRKGVWPGTPEFQEAKDAGQRAVHSKPDFALPYDVVSVLYLRAGQTSQAADATRLALKADPEDSTAVYHLIVYLRKEDDNKELPQLVKKLAEMSTAARERTAAVNRYKLAEKEAHSASSGHSNSFSYNGVRQLLWRCWLRSIRRRCLRHTETKRERWRAGRRFQTLLREWPKRSTRAVVSGPVRRPCLGAFHRWRQVCSVSS